MLEWILIGQIGCPGCGKVAVVVSRHRVYPNIYLYEHPINGVYWYLRVSITSGKFIEHPDFMEWATNTVHKGSFKQRAPEMDAIKRLKKVLGI